VATLPDVESIDIQTEIQWFMRPYLLDFLIEAHAAFQLLPATLFLIINILDRYCSKRVVYKRHYQLVGCAALLVAAKYGDKKDRVPTIKELKSMCCSLYDDDMFTQMEWHVLQTLGWTMGHPTADSFLQIAVLDTPDEPE
ncbi:G1 S-specific cyclin, partial [Aspergillus sclerotialis]